MYVATGRWPSIDNACPTWVSDRDETIVDASTNPVEHGRTEPPEGSDLTRMVGTFGQKPSDSHVVWTNRAGEGQGKKRFDFEYLELWTAHFGIDYENRTRVDHERSDEPRDQHLVVFEWATAKNETIEMGDSTWELGGNETPRTFVEIDESGMARLKSWEHEVVLDLRELWIDGPVLRMKTADRGKKSFDTRKLLEGNRPSKA